MPCNVAVKQKGVSVSNRFSGTPSPREAPRPIGHWCPPEQQTQPVLGFARDPKVRVGSPSWDTVGSVLHREDLWGTSGADSADLCGHPGGPALGEGFQIARAGATPASARSLPH